MVKRRVMFTYPPELIEKPIIFNLSQQSRVAANIVLADISAESGWVVLELDGQEADIEQGLGWATSRGIRVDAYPRKARRTGSRSDH